MTLLPYDLTRCLGEGNAGRQCPKREACQRYIQRHTPAGVGLRRATLLCRSHYENWIPVVEQEAA